MSEKPNHYIQLDHALAVVGAARRYHVDKGCDAVAMFDFIRAQLEKGADPEPVTRREVVDTPEGGIPLIPTWAVAIDILLLVLEDGTDKGKELAREELREMARKMDALNTQFQGAA